MITVALEVHYGIGKKIVSFLRVEVFQNIPSEKVQHWLRV